MPGNMARAGRLKKYERSNDPTPFVKIKGKSNSGSHWGTQHLRRLEIHFEADCKVEDVFKPTDPLRSSCKVAICIKDYLDIPWEDIEARNPTTKNIDNLSPCGHMRTLALKEIPPGHPGLSSQTEPWSARRRGQSSQPDVVSDADPEDLANPQYRETSPRGSHQRFLNWIA